MVHPIIYVCSSTAFWVSLYQHLCSTNKREGEWNCRLIAAIHAVVLTSLALWCAYYTGPWPFTNPGGETTLFQELVLSLSLGYFIFDLSWCLNHKTEGTVMLVHHFATIISLLYSVCFQISGTELIAALGGAEISNPLLQLRWFLRNAGLKRSGLAVTIVEYIFTLVFLFARGILGSYFLYCVVSHPRPDWFVKLGGIVIYIISMIFVGMILRYLYRKQFKNCIDSEEEKDSTESKDKVKRVKKELKFVDSPVRFEESKVR